LAGLQPAVLLQLIGESIGQPVIDHATGICGGD
jgi:hypothetical protein